MKITFATITLFFAALLFCGKIAFCQKKKQKPLDSVLEANSEKWKVKLHKGMFGMAKPEFGPYTTVDIEKLDSPILRTRTKEGSYSGASISSEGWDWDFSKYETVEKRKAYRMIVAGEADTAELLFSIYRVSKEKSLTFLGELMSKNDEGKSATLSYKSNISGIIATGNGVPWRFFMEDSSSTKEESVPSETTRVTRWYLMTGNDSLFTEPIMLKVGTPGSKYYWESQTGIFVNNSTGNHIAALKFGTRGDLSNPFVARIRKDIEPPQQQAIASLFALLIGAMTQ